ncbi:hypothetical protein DKP84_07205 [Acinetobacter pittii]|nr:hypothetical protein DKP84_07205 [Acinetobacter pittii]
MIFSLFIFCVCLVFYTFVFLCLVINNKCFKKFCKKKYNIWYLITGYSILVIALALSIYQWGKSIGICYWIGTLSFAALLILWLLSYYPIHLKLVNQFSRVIILALLMFDLLV